MSGLLTVYIQALPTQGFQLVVDHRRRSSRPEPVWNDQGDS